MPVIAPETDPAGIPAGNVPGPLLSCTPPPSGTILNTSCSNSGSPTSVGAASQPYTLTTRLVLTIPIGDSSAYNAQGQTSITAIPEPGSMFLLGTGLLGTAGMIRRRLAKKK
jgi:hypothetical protein